MHPDLIYVSNTTAQFFSNFFAEFVTTSKPITTNKPTNQPLTCDGKDKRCPGMRTNSQRPTTCAAEYLRGFG